MNNRGQNVNPNGIPQNHYPNQGYSQQNSQYQGNGYNGQNPQNFNRNVNNQNPYPSQNSQANNVNNQQFQGYSNGQNQPQNNMNSPQYRGQGYNGQSPQNNNMNTPQYRGQGYNNQNQQYNNINNQQYRAQGNNGQNPQFGNPNNPQFSNQNGYNNPNQFNPQFGNNQNFKPMNRGPKMDSKIIGYITAAVAAILVVLMIFMFSSGSGKLGGRTPEEAAENVISAEKDGDFEKLGGATPEEAAKNYMSAAKDGDLKKLVNNMNIKSDKGRTEHLEQLNNLGDVYKKETAERFSDMEIGEVKSINENSAEVEVKVNGDPGTMYAKKVNGRWFILEL